MIHLAVHQLQQKTDTIGVRSSCRTWVSFSFPELRRSLASAAAQQRSRQVKTVQAAAAEQATCTEKWPQQRWYGRMQGHCCTQRHRLLHQAAGSLNAAATCATQPAICCHPPPTCNDEDGVGPRLAHQHLFHVVGIQLNQASALQRLHASNLQEEKTAMPP